MLWGSASYILMCVQTTRDLMKMQVLMRQGWGQLRICITKKLSDDAVLLAHRTHLE